MKKTNVILQAAIASALLVMAGTASATTVSVTAPAFAKELLQGSSAATTALTIPLAGLGISVLANVGIPANSVVYVYVKIAGASLSALPSVAPGNAAAAIDAAAAGVSATMTAANLGTTTGTANPTGVGAGVDYLVFKLTTGATAIGVGNTVAIIGGAASGGGTTLPVIVNNAAAMLTAPLTVTASVGLGAPATRFGAMPVIATNFDAASTAVNLATTVQGITIAAAAATNAGQIDLTANPVASQFTSATTVPATTNLGISAILAKLGTVTVTDGTTSLASLATGVASSYTLAASAGATGFSTTVAAPAGFFTALGATGVLTLDTSATCTTGVAGVNGMASAALGTAAAAAGATSIAIPSTALPTAGTSYTVCMFLPAHTATSPAIVAGTPTIAATLAHNGTVNDSNNTLAATNLYAMTLNGASYDVRNYVPSGAVGYTTYVRVINTGSLPAAVSAALVDEATGVAGAAGVLGTLASGAAVNYTSAQVEAVVGAVAATARPRIRISGPTNGLQVQTFLAQPNGTISDMTGAQ